MTKVAIVLGPSRSQGDSFHATHYLVNHCNATLFDLSQYSISFYDYEHHNSSDDFLPLMAELIEFEHIIFATPVYWYSMSAQMKVFIDRLSDLLTIDKPLGRKLKGTSCSLVSTGFDLAAPDCLWQPFELTANYLGMEYTDMLYCACPQGFNINAHKDKLDQHLRKVTAK